MSTLIKIICFFLFLVILLRWILIPLLFAQLTQFRVTAIGIFGARELEYRKKGQSGAVVPDLRVERIGWAWGGLKEDDVGLFILRVNGVSLRIRRKSKDAEDTSSRPRPSGRIAAWKSRMLSSVLHLLIHHYPSLARVISLQVSDIRLIFDDLDGLEVTVKDLRTGVNVTFDGDSAPLDTISPASPRNSPLPPQGEFKRANPLASPTDEFSPPAYPFTQFSTFAFPDSVPCPVVETGRVSRMAHAKRRASVFHTRMSSTASQVWSRAIARAQGSVSFVASIHDIAVILPHGIKKDSLSQDASPFEYSQAANKMSHQPFSKSVISEPERRPRPFTSVSSIHSLLHPQLPKYARPPAEGGFERLLSIDGRSRAVFDLGFGPKKGLMGEDTLRTDVQLGRLCTSLGALDKVQDLIKARLPVKEDMPVRMKKNQWTPRSIPRIILRAFESVSVSLKHVTLSHYLPTSTSSPTSANSSVSDMTEITAEQDMFTVSIDLSELVCRLDAADSTTNQRSRNAFGTNPSPESKVRGIGFLLGWDSVALQCVAPGEKTDERTQLVQVRTAEFEGLSTWRPTGWSREELRFASDPNLALVIGKGSIASIDVAGDVQLVDELNQAWKNSRPNRPPPPVHMEPRKPFSLPPRVRYVLEIGHAMVLVADRVSEHKTTLTLASDGFHLGCYTSYSDVIARRRDKAGNKTAFKQEEDLRHRREQAGDEADYALPTTMLKPQLRRHFTQSEAKLQDDYSISMRADALLALEPMSLHMTLSGEREREQQTYHLASIGRAHGTLSGDILGRQDVKEDGSEIAQLDPESISCGLDLGIDSGVKLNLWNMPVVNALTAMAYAHQPPTSPHSFSTSGSLLCRLPSGISARVSLGLLSVFIGHEDPNPNCKLKLTRGLWIQTTPVFEYAYYSCRAQAMQCRHSLSAPSRAKLRLPEDITTQALAFFNHLSNHEGRAALVSCALVDTFVKPIFNGKRFTEAGGTSLSHQHPHTPRERQGDNFVGWEFRRPGPKSSLAHGQFANNVPPLDISDTDQAARPLLRVPHVSVNWLVQRANSECGIEHKITSRIGSIEIVCDLSHIYCALLATSSIRKIATAAKKPRPIGERRPPLDLSFEISLPSIKAHFAFPLKEHLYVYVDNGSVSKPAFAGVNGTAYKVLAFVPSAREVGSWEEIARIKQLGVRSADPDQAPAFTIKSEALRIRIPVAYQLSKLVLNISVTVKAMKLLLQDLGEKGFSTVRKPGSEQPKRIPPISFNLQQISLEAKDDPIETNLNLIWRAGMAEQEIRNSLEDAFEQKVRLMEEARMAYADGEEPQTNGHSNGYGKLTDKAATSFEDARYRLDWWKSRSWTKRIRAAKQEQRRREQATLRSVQDAGLANVRLPITVVQSTHTAPLFRAALHGVKMSIADLGWSREEILDYMGKVSSPFDDNVQFSLMVPIKLSWTMDQARATLRDYPLPLVRIQPVLTGDRPAWHVETPFIIAEELAGDDSLVLVPCEVVPEGCGASSAHSFTVQIAKTIMPVKTYSRPEINILTSQTTELTWGNSDQPAIQDFMKVIESLSHPPRDPSPRVGFWDKFRLILHWKVTVNFVGNVHLHLKGSYDPYSVMGYGAGFALAWKGGTKLEINQPNEQYETIQISSKELLIAIPDLTALHDHAALGSDSRNPPGQIPPEGASADQSLISRRYTKPCARFLNGVRVGFGFVLERTCRAHNCTHHCGETENLLHRQCRMFTFKKHQDVTLRSPEALEREEERLGRAVDSYEGFRSDYIHFSVSVVAPLDEFAAENVKDADKHNSLHFSPKAFAHFFHWWKLFDHNMSLPIRQGRLFPDSPPPSKKFGRSLGTIKYRFDLAPVYLSHIYQQVSKDLWAAGKSQSLGIKARFDRFRADAHQRAQEKTVRHEKLHRTSVVVHKPFYAADLLLDGIALKGVRADFVETVRPSDDDIGEPKTPKASELPKETRAWYNFFDFIDADRKPFDRDPEVEIVDVMDCPQVFFSKRVKARQTTPHDDDDSSLGSENDSRLDIESSKFGHEKSHICYLGAAAGVGPTQIRITQQRIQELEERAKDLGSKSSPELKNIQNRLRTLYRHLQELSQKEDRHIDDDTFQQTEDQNHPANLTLNRAGEVSFENTFHVHCPRVFYNNTSRNIIYKYWFSSRDRKREEYTTSHASLRGVRDGIQRRIRRFKTGFNQDDLPKDTFPLREDAALEMLRELQEVFQDKNASTLFRLPADHDADIEDLGVPSLGLPADCVPKPHNRFLILKPQIALRSEAGENAIVLLTVEEISFRGFAVLDEIASDAVSADVLNRNYVSMKGLQAFYPTDETMCRDKGPAGMPRGLDFVPLEIFLDVRSEATDYDRIVLKADAALSFDKFNQLRMPRGLEWPETKDDNGRDIQHLRLHQDLTTVIVPRLTVSATSKHYNALYTVVTDLLLYQDPEHRQRSERIDNFTFAFDRTDRDPQRLIMDLFGLQHSIRSLSTLQRGYEANVDLLSDEGKNELFKIRTDLLEATEQLFTVFEAIAVNQARDDARAALKSASRMDVRVGLIAWHMLQDNLAPLMKLDIEGTIYSWVSNKDGSNDSAVAFGDLSALNSDAEALYPEVLVRYESANYKRRSKETFASACWSILAPVGGITIVRYLAFYIHPVRFRLEEKVGHAIVDYIFSDRVKRRNEIGTSTPKGEGKENGIGLGHPEGHRSQLGLRTPSGMELPPLNRTKSQLSLASTNTADIGNPDAKFQLVPTKDAAEMRRRAGANKTFVKVIFGSTSFVLSYKTDESKKHRTFSMPDCVDFKIKTPEMSYSNKVWGYEDVFEHVKRDIRSYAWSQTGDLLSQIIKKTSLFRSKKNLKHLASISSDMPSGYKGSTLSAQSTSRLRFTVDPPTPLDDEASHTIALARALSREQTSPLARSGTRSTSESTPQILGVPIVEAPSHMGGEDGEGIESDREGGSGKKRVKGLFEKLKKHTAKLDTNGSHGSNDELSKVMSPDRSSKRSTPSLSPVSKTTSRDHQSPLYT